MNKFMRLLVMFDLPVTGFEERRSAVRFRQFLIKDGFNMMQFSIYVRICNGTDDVNKHIRRLYENVPDNGSVRCLTVTEKQFEAMHVLTGDLTVAEQSASDFQVTFF